MLNVHTRSFAAPIDAVRPWIEACWTGGPRDALPRVLGAWRKNPPDVLPGALIPGTTMMGHGPFRFRLVEWDGLRWRVEVMGRAAGWHGFDLVPDGARTRITHTLELHHLPGGWLAQRVLIPMHDWAVEAIFDNLEAALRTGDMPPHTLRPVPPLARLLFGANRRLRHAVG